MSCFSWFYISLSILLLLLLLLWISSTVVVGILWLLIVVENLTHPTSSGAHLAARRMAEATKWTMSGGQACCPHVPVPRGQLLGCGEAKFCV